MEIQKTANGHHDDGLHEMDQDHRTLEQLFEQAHLICEYFSSPSVASVACDGCTADRRGACCKSLKDIGGKIAAQMLDHFGREDRLMASLPRTCAVDEHCADHRSAHADFSSRFNQAAAQCDPSQPIRGLRALNAFTLEWAGIAMGYDKDLLALVKQHRSAAPTG